MHSLIVCTSTLLSKGGTPLLTQVTQTLKRANNNSQALDIEILPIYFLTIFMII